VIKLLRSYKEIKRAVKKKNLGGYEDFIYQKFEDYAFLQKSTISFAF
jgi:hypothetical protein